MSSKVSEVIRGYIVAAFEPLRIGLDSALVSASNIEVIGQASSLSEMVGSGDFQRADVLLLDTQVVNTIDNEEMLNKIYEALSPMKILFLGNHQDVRASDFDALLRWIHLDTFGFLFKDGSAERLIEAVKLVSAGVAVFEMQLLKNVAARLSRWLRFTDEELRDQISEREKEVVRLVAQGRSNKEIARELFLSEGTVKAHISHILGKLNLERRADLVRYALSRGLISLDEE